MSTTLPFGIEMIDKERRINKRYRIKENKKYPYRKNRKASLYSLKGGYNKNGNKKETSSEENNKGKKTTNKVATPSQ